MLTYGDLPEPRPDTVFEDGSRICARQPVLLCPSCMGSFSAHPGDYFTRADAEPIVCLDCDEPMVLAERLAELYVPIGKDRDLFRAMRALWDA